MPRVVSRVVPAVAAVLLLAPAVVVQTAFAARSGEIYTDGANDLEGGPGPDIRAITISNTRSSLTFSVRFGSSPPLVYDEAARLEDFLLVRVDVPPLGTPRFRGGPVADFVVWTSAGEPKVAHLENQRGRIRAVFARVLGRVVRFSVPLRALRDPRVLRFAVVAEREGRATDDQGSDLLPNRGMLRYTVRPA